MLEVGPTFSVDTVPLGLCLLDTCSRSGLLVCPCVTPLSQLLTPGAHGQQLGNERQRWSPPRLMLLLPVVSWPWPCLCWLTMAPCGRGQPRARAVWAPPLPARAPWHRRHPNSSAPSEAKTFTSAGAPSPASQGQGRPLSPRPTQLFYLAERSVIIGKEHELTHIWIPPLHGPSLYQQSSVCGAQRLQVTPGPCPSAFVWAQIPTWPHLFLGQDGFLHEAGAGRRNQHQLPAKSFTQLAGGAQLASRGVAGRASPSF